MDFTTDKKFEYAIFALVAVLVGGLGYLFKSPVQTAIANAELIYEMPRPKSFLATLFGFGLEDREIDRKYVNPFDKKKKDDAKKIADTKAPAAPAAKVAQKKADGKKADAAKKPKVEVNVVAADAVGMHASDIADGFGGGGVAANNAAQNADAQNQAKNAKADGTMSGDQWRSLISGQPTKENVTKLITAYMTKDVDDATFYTIMADLLRNNKSETQALGLYAASTVYSVQSFAVVTENYEQLTQDNQTKAHSYLLSYATSGRSNALLAALKSSNAEVVEMATNVVVQGYQTAKNNPSTGTSDPRNSRGDVNTSSNNNVSDYSKFITVFQELKKSSDATIASLASQALSTLQTSTVASL